MKNARSNPNIPVCDIRKNVLIQCVETPFFIFTQKKYKNIYIQARQLFLRVGEGNNLRLPDLFELLEIEDYIL